jgi:hypothetical protein
VPGHEERSGSGGLAATNGRPQIKKENQPMLFLIYAILAVVTIIAYYTGWLTRNNLEWLVYVFAATILPAVLWL